MQRLRAALASREASSIQRPAEDRRAAVAAILRPNQGDVEVLFIRRAKHPDDPWSGHMAFPGGRHDEADLDVLHTAVRETLEEVGVDLRSDAALLGRLDDIDAVARGRRVGLWVSPFVFQLERDVSLSPNAEVDAALWTPLGPLRRGEGAITVPYRYNDLQLDLPGFRVGADVVWGLTHRMLMSLFDVLDEGDRST